MSASTLIGPDLSNVSLSSLSVICVKSLLMLLFNDRKLADALLNAVYVLLCLNSQFGNNPGFDHLIQNMHLSILYMLSFHHCWHLLACGHLRRDNWSFWSCEHQWFCHLWCFLLRDFKLINLHVRDNWYFCVVSSI